MTTKTTTINWNSSTGGAVMGISAPDIASGDRVVSVVRNDTGDDVTSNYGPFAPIEGYIVQLPGPIAPGSISSSVTLTVTYELRT